MTAAIFQGIIELKVLPNVFHNFEPTSKHIYGSLIAALNQCEISRPLDPTVYSGYYIKEQRSGTCSFKALLVALRYLILDKSKKNPDALPGLYKAYKRIRFAHRKTVLLKHSSNFFHDKTKWDREAHKVISENVKLLARAASKLHQKLIICRDEFNLTLATVKDIRNRLARKKQKFYTSLKRLKFAFNPQILNPVSQPVKFSYFKNNDDRKIQRSGNKKSNERPTKVQHLNSFKMPKNRPVSPENITTLFQEWSGLNLQDFEQARHWEFASLLNSVTEVLHCLPIPVKGDESGFWYKVPKKDIVVCLEGLFKLCRIYIMFSAHFDKFVEISSSAFIEINAALAIADTLARRNPECRLQGFQLPVQQIVTSPYGGTLSFGTLAAATLGG